MPYEGREGSISGRKVGIITHSEMCIFFYNTHPVVTSAGKTEREVRPWMAQVEELNLENIMIKLVFKNYHSGPNMDNRLVKAKVEADTIRGLLQGSSWETMKIS